MRYDKLDILRWIAISMMIVFHINYSLLNIFSNSFLNFSEIFWSIFWSIWWLLFITISALSFLLSEKKHWDKVNKKYLKYALILWIIAIFITVFTYIFIREQIILFGILHFFSLSFLLIVFFRKLRYTNLLIWISIILIPIVFDITIDSKYLFFTWFIPHTFYSADFWPLIPYFWVFLTSYTISLYLYEKNILHKILSWEKKWFVYNFLKFMWKNSLVIYLIHVPIIVSLIYLLVKIWLIQ